MAAADPINIRSSLLILNKIIWYRSAHTASCCNNSVLISAVVIRFLLIFPQYRCCLVFNDWWFLIERWFFNNHSFTDKLIPRKNFPSGIITRGVRLISFLSTTKNLLRLLNVLYSFLQFQQYETV